MEKVDVLLIAVLIFGAASFFAVSYCVILGNSIKYIISILDRHKELFKDYVKLFENFQSSFKNQNEFNKCTINNINKVDTKIISVLKDIDRIKEELDMCDSPTGGGEADAEPLSK